MLTTHTENKNLLFLKDFVLYTKRNIGVFAGSFNPFHIGHLNIVEKGEDIFDKVIIARGKNPKKTHIDIELMEYSYVVDKVYEGLLNYASNEQIECYAFEKNNVISEVWMKSMVIKGTKEEQIKAYYRNYLKREVDEEGLNIYLNSGLSMEEILNKILSSEEYKNIR
jgi:cytidyltransferase-like protein